MNNITLEDDLNYRIIMEGFYYDAQIQHIAEIVKNILYFAVLDGEDPITLKNTIDTIYFNTDEELIYNNYYFDFGPLNMSCLYKYCYKLNGYLQYGQGLKRIVHYTSCDPSKRTNAAFLMGCYTIINLKMEPNDINDILECAGGQYREFVDASQGGSQYTISLLDCFQAIQKALIFNFFDLTDFNVFEYDFHDKLQNGDMNWLVPRKFLAFIGPTENELLNGHRPEFYVKYFLDNDIKTVVRLNNKLYEASTFTRRGIDHYELFFPDGTVPPKSILLQFLEISETARAAIAVHCKAGLGRTGSLIGAYIIKHYRMTAREAIAWMRVCRPGSVIGQQQGWLEKIQAWLWKQGSHYRIRHFGEGDKIPRHKYGIYSKEWPKERENLIKHVQKRRLDSQSSKTTYRSDNVARLLKDLPVSTQGNVCDSITNRKSEERRHSAGTQKTCLTSSIDHYTCVEPCNIVDNVSPRNSSLDRNLSRLQHSQEAQYKDDTSNIIRTKRLANYSSKQKERQTFLGDSEHRESNNFEPRRYVSKVPTYMSHDTNNRYDIQQSKPYIPKLKRREQSTTKELLGDRQTRMPTRSIIDGMEQTQGDKLNEIKAKKFVNFVCDNIPIKIRSSKLQRQPEVKYPKPEASTSNFKTEDTRNKPKYEFHY